MVFRMSILLWAVAGLCLGLGFGMARKKSRAPGEKMPPSGETPARKSAVVKLEYKDQGLFGDLRDE